VFGLSRRGVSEGKLMAHAVFTIVADVCGGHEQALGTLLQAIQDRSAGNADIDFALFSTLHFSSLTLFPPSSGAAGQGRSLLVFEHNVDGSWREHIDALVDRAQAGLQAIYQHCEGFPSQPTKASLRAYLRDHVRHPDLYHIGTPYRRAETIRADLHLRRLMDRRIDGYTRDEAGRPASQIWRDLWEHVRQPGAGGAAAALPEPEPRARTRIVNWSVALLIAIAAVAVTTAGIWWLWPTPARLSLAIVALFLVFGMATAILIGWPVLPADRTRRNGETDADVRRALRSGWRTTINIWVWFAIVGWIVSLAPAVPRLAGFHPGYRVLSALLLGLITIGVLVFMVGQWSLPTPCLAEPDPDRAVLARVKAQEDVRVINHMSAMVTLRPGLLRRTLLRLLLWGLNRVWFRTWLPDRLKGRLFNFSTVHFAQWVVLDQNRYLFLSNYDHSFSRYLDDFGNISFGLARLWGMGAHTPGLSSLERFKEFARSWMTPHSVWYAAYPDTAVTQVWNNEALRRGLARPPESVEHRELLQRLVNAKER
jgi:hypothetical protein